MWTQILFLAPRGLVLTGPSISSAMQTVSNSKSEERSQWKWSHTRWLGFSLLHDHHELRCCQRFCLDREENMKISSAGFHWGVNGFCGAPGCKGFHADCSLNTTWPFVFRFPSSHELTAHVWGPEPVTFWSTPETRTLLLSLERKCFLP